MNTRLNPTQNQRAGIVNPALPFSQEQLVKHFISQQSSNSRTFRGISDTSSSEQKQSLNFSGEELKTRVKDNVERQLIRALQEVPPSFSNSIGAQLWIFHLSLKINEGLTKEGVPVLRTWETKVSYQTHPSKLEEACLRFSEEFFHKWSSVDTDPIRFAAWTEQEWNGKIHPLSDGCGRTSKTIAALILARKGIPYPMFESREEFFSHIGDSFESWQKFYAERVERAIVSLTN